MTMYFASDRAICPVWQSRLRSLFEVWPFHVVDFHLPLWWCLPCSRIVSIVVLAQCRFERPIHEWARILCTLCRSLIYGSFSRLSYNGLGVRWEAPGRPMFCPSLFHFSGLHSCFWGSPEWHFSKYASIFHIHFLGESIWACRWCWGLWNWILINLMWKFLPISGLVPPSFIPLSLSKHCRFDHCFSLRLLERF